MPYIVRRALLLLPTLLGVATVVFLVLRVIPGDPAILLAGDTAQRQDIAVVRHRMGLDRPLFVQYLQFLRRDATGDLGISFRTLGPVSDEIRNRAPRTLELAVAATALTAVIGIPAGVWAAQWPRGVPDTVVLAGSALGLSFSAFWIGLVLIWIFGVKLGLFPVAGAEGWRALVLPSVSLALGPVAIMARTVRAGVVEALTQDYIRTARAKGLGRRVVLYGHALRNALIPAVTLIGLNFGSLLASAVLVEIVFSWPGLGRSLLEALHDRDFPVIQGVTLTLAVLFLLANLIVDLAYSLLDPRIRYS